MTPSSRRTNGRPPKRPSRTPAWTEGGAGGVQTATKVAVGPVRVATLCAIGIIALAVMAFALVNEANVDRRIPIADAPSAVPAFFARQEFKDWFAAWKEKDRYLSLEELRLTDTAAFALDEATARFVPETIPQHRIVVAPDRTKYVDFLASHGEPDSRIDVGGVLDGGRVNTVAFCGTDCSYDRAFWTSSDAFIVLGTVTSYKPDGTPLCTTTEETTRCYIRLTATEYDLKEGKRRTYASADRMTDANPFDAEKSRLWFKDRPATERVAAGMTETADLVPFSGSVITAADDVLTVNLDDGRTRIVTLVSGKVGTKLAADARIALDAGATVSGFGVEDGALSIVAVELSVTKPADAIVTSPTMDQTVPRTFEVDLSVASTVKAVDLRIANADGDVEIAKTVKTSGEPINGRYLLTIPIALSRTLESGSSLELTVAPEGKPQGKTIHLTYAK